MEWMLILLVGILAAGVGFLAFSQARPKAPLSDPRLDSLLAAQGEIGGRFQASVAAQESLTRTLSERLAALEQRMGDSLKDSAEKTGQTLGSITERLNVIDAAQKNITELSGQVVSLQQIFSDKQQRGAFAQQRMEAIVADQFPPGHYDFQFTLSNGKRPDCVIRIPNVPGMVVIDSKFPWEAFEALRTAEEGTRKGLMGQLRTDMQKHVKDIADKYLIPGEVQTPAIMFVPSESLYAELHLSFPDIIQDGRRRGVMIMSPHVFLLALGTLQALMRDARMREETRAIQQEVGQLLKDVRLLGDRVGNLRTHFERTSKDIGEIEKPMGRIATRAERIERAEIGADRPAALPDN